MSNARLLVMMSLVSTANSSPVSGVEQRLPSDELLVHGPHTNQGKEERVKAVDDRVDEVAGKDGGQVEAETGGDGHEHEAGDEGLGHQGEEGEGRDQGEDHAEGPGEHGGELAEPLHQHLGHNKVKVLML